MNIVSTRKTWKTCRRAAAMTALCFVTMAAAPAARGGSPVLFDVAETIACRDVTPPDGVPDEPDMRMIEATLHVSVRFAPDEDATVEEILVTFAHDEPATRVVAFSPETELASDVAGEIELETKVENSTSFGASLGGGIPVPYGAIIAQVSPSANATTAKRNLTTETMKRLPKMEAVIVSGTTDRGRGVFFKLRRSSQRTLEGVQPLTVRFTVPAEWRLGRARVTCRAVGEERVLWIRQSRTWPATTLPVILYEEGDQRAKTAAEEACVAAK